MSATSKPTAAQSVTTSTAAAPPKPSVSMFDQSAYVQHVVQLTCFNFRGPGRMSGEPQTSEGYLVEFGNQRKIVRKEREFERTLGEATDARPNEALGNAVVGIVGTDRPTAIVMQYSATTGFVTTLLIDSSNKFFKAMITHESNLAGRDPKDLTGRLKRLDDGFARSDTWIRENASLIESQITTDLVEEPNLPDKREEPFYFPNSTISHMYVMIANFGTQPMKDGWHDMGTNHTTATTSLYGIQESLDIASTNTKTVKALILEYFGEGHKRIVMNSTSMIRSIESGYQTTLRELLSLAMIESQELLFLLNRPEEILRRAGELTVRITLGIVGGINLYKKLKAEGNNGTVVTFQALFNAEVALRNQREPINAAIQERNKAANFPKQKGDAQNTDDIDNEWRTKKAEIDDKKKAAEKASKEAIAKAKDQFVLGKSVAAKLAQIREPVDKLREIWNAAKDGEKDTAWDNYNDALMVAIQANEAFLHDTTSQLSAEDRPLQEAYLKTKREQEEALKKTHKALDAEYETFMYGVNDVGGWYERKGIVEEANKEKVRKIEAAEKELADQLIAHTPTLFLLPNTFKPKDASAAVQTITESEYHQLIDANPLAKLAYNTHTNPHNLPAFNAQYANRVYAVQTGEGIRYAIAIPTTYSLGFTPNQFGGKDAAGIATFLNSFFGSSPKASDPILAAANLALDAVLPKSIAQVKLLADGFIDQGLWHWAAFEFAESYQVQQTLKSEQAYNDFVEAYKAANDGSYPSVSECANFAIREWMESFRKSNNKEPNLHQKVDQLKLEWMRRIRLYHSKEQVRARAVGMLGTYEDPTTIPENTLTTWKHRIAHETVAVPKTGLNPANGKTETYSMSYVDHAIRRQVKKFSNEFALVDDLREALVPTLLAGIKEFDGAVTTSKFHEPMTRYFLGGAIRLIHDVAQEALAKYRATGTLNPFTMLKDAISAANKALVAMKKDFESLATAKGKLTQYFARIDVGDVKANK